jgi:acyl-coenzyme A thioesterase PaaI-like protein
VIVADDWSLKPGNIPWGNRLGLELVSSGDGLGSMRVAWRQDLSDVDEVLAPGVLASLIDQACGVAVMSRLGRRLAISTLNLKVDHLRTAEARCSATAWAHCYDATEHRAFVRAEVWDTNPSHLVATAQGVFSINRVIVA